MPTEQRTADAERLAARLKELLGHDHVVVRPHGRHLNIRLVEDEIETVVARLTETRPGTFEAAFRNHSGRWEPLPGAGDLGDAAQIVVDCLEPYLQPYP